MFDTSCRKPRGLSTAAAIAIIGTIAIIAGALVFNAWWSASSITRDQTERGEELENLVRDFHASRRQAGEHREDSVSDQLAHDSQQESAEGAEVSEHHPENVPPELVPFLPIVEKWGAIGSDDERYALADKADADPAALAELEAFRDAFTPELGSIYEEWADRESLIENETVARFYFTFLLIDELGFRSPPDENADRVGELMHELTLSGSPRKDSDRVWAARQLPDYGDEARRAVAALRNALNDPKPNVRIWAHYALARIEGDVATHRQAIQEIGAEDQSEDIDLDVRSALDDLDRTPQEQNIEALTGFCITNEVRHIRRLAKITDVDATDHNGARPLEYAVGNGHIEAVQILLEHGADPTFKDKSGESCLHFAAACRRNQEMIRLLVDHGADVNVRTPDGETPLDIAVACGRNENAAVLAELGGVRSQ